MKKHFSLATLAAAAGLSALLVACQDSTPAEPPINTPTVQGDRITFAAGHPQLALLGITAAAPGKSVTVELPARLVWNEDRTQRLYAPFAGRVTAIRADVGQMVKPGAVLAQLASPDFGQAQADTTRAQIDERLSQKTLQRSRELFDAGIVARKDLEQAEADAERARAESQRAAARTHLYGGTGVGGQQMALTAGVAGVVVERNINPGQELRPDQSGPGVPALFVVSDPTSLWVQVDARETEAGTLRPGATFTLAIPTLPGQVFEARVISASDFIDPLTRTIKIRGVVANPERRLKAEMLATARFERTLGAGVVVPASAVILRGAVHSVFVQVQPGVFEPREVSLGYTGPKDVVVTRGLEVGEQVVSENTLLLARQFRSTPDDVPSPKPTAAASAASSTTSAAKP